MENQRQIIINQLKALQNRARNQVMIEYITLCLFIGLCILAILYTVIRLFPIPFALFHMTTSIVGIAVVIGIYLGLRSREKLAGIACLVDNTMHLKDRVGTSLEVILKRHIGEIVDLQIGDSAEAITNSDPKKILPYLMPALIKWVSIPIVIMALSFTIPRQYELPKPLVDAELNAIDKAIANLTEQSVSISDSKIRDEISRTIEKLMKVTDVNAAHEHLHRLNSKVREQKSELPDEEAIAQATQDTQHFTDMDTTALANELDKLSEQLELTPELQDQLAKLFAKLSENIPRGKLRERLDQIDSQVVSPETLQEIADALHQANQFKLLEEQLIDSRKDIAIAGIETGKSSGNIAGSDSAPGQESGNIETQGTQVEIKRTDFNPTSEYSTSSVQDNTTSVPLTGDETPSIQITGNELAIKSSRSSDAGSVSRVFAGSKSSQGSEPEYLEFRDVVLVAQRQYAQAIENDHIPVRYRTQIKAYLEAISKVNEK